MTGSPGPSSDQEALQEEFLGALEALGGSAGNGRLRELLTWEEGLYEAVRGSLLAAERLSPGQGRGGSVSLAAGAGPEPLGPQPTGKQNLSAFIWSVADLLRGDYKQSDYGKVILPSHLNDPDLDRVSAALLRAGERARQLARQTGTGIAVEIDGELRILEGAELDKAMETRDAG